MRAWLLLAAGCSPDLPARFLVVDGREGDYGLVEAPIPELEDPRRMRGSLGDGRVGGRARNKVLEITGGGPIRLDYSVQDGVGVPHTDDGLVLWSYYHALSRVRDELGVLGVDVEPIFPVDFLYQIEVLGQVQTTTNAAYASSGVHLFLLRADPKGSTLPLAANPGVIRHEFGHALFQLVVAGAVDVSDPGQGLPEMRAVNEGFADMLATLSLDDPQFLLESMPLPARLVDGDATVADAKPPEEDPYSRGTVYASLAWDLREASDPDTTLLLAVRALERWASEEPPPWEQGLAGADRFPQLLVELAVTEDPSLAGPLCEAYTRRMQAEPLEVCP